MNHLPTEKDMAKAFKTADMDNSGLVDEQEFLELYSHVRDGNERLARGFFARAIEGKKDKIVVKASLEKKENDGNEDPNKAAAPGAHLPVGGGAGRGGRTGCGTPRATGGTTS